MNGNKIQIVCALCGSANVRRDAYAAWNTDLQEWELSAVFDNSTCEDCEDTDASLIEIALEEKELFFAEINEEDFKKEVLKHYPEADIFVDGCYLIACFSKEDRELVGCWHQEKTARIWPGYKEQL